MEDAAFVVSVVKFSAIWGDWPRLSYFKGNGLPHPCRSCCWSDRVGVRGPRWNPTLRQNRAKGWGNLQRQGGSTRTALESDPSPKPCERVGQPASRFIQFSPRGDPHERIHKSYALIQQRVHHLCVLGTLVADSRHPVRPLLHSRVHRIRPSAAGRRIGRRTGSLLRRRSHADSDRDRVLRLGCPQSYVVRGGAQDTLADAGQDGWGAAATAASAAVGALFLLLTAVVAALAYPIASSGNQLLTSALNDFAWAGFVLTSFPRGMLIMAAAFGLWRARQISNALFAGGVAAVVLVLLGGTTWLSGGFWAPDGVYSRFVSPAIGLVWGMVVSAVLLTRSPATRAGW